mmetsp:Transcript_13414/g.56745  ORF Transcript_13414/g.56745 Transcript_13414/m.56745 type:complete len:260 (-) Transcript_13414:718-1497(-)
MGQFLPIDSSSERHAQEPVGHHRDDVKVRRDAREHVRVEPVQEPPVSRDDIPAVLHPRVALHHALHQIARHRRDEDHGAQHQRLHRTGVPAQEPSQTVRGGHGASQSPERALDRLVGRHGDEPVLAEGLPKRVRADVARDDARDADDGDDQAGGPSLRTPQRGRPRVDKGAPRALEALVDGGGRRGEVEHAELDPERGQSAAVDDTEEGARELGEVRLGLHLDQSKADGGKRAQHRHGDVPLLGARQVHDGDEQRAHDD